MSIIGINLLFHKFDTPKQKNGGSYFAGDSKKYQNYG